MASLLVKLDPASDDFPGERFAAELIVVLDSWSSSLRKKVREPGSIAESLSNELVARPLRPSKTTSLRSGAGGSLRVERRFFRNPQVKDRNSFLRGWDEYFSVFASLEVAELEIYGLKMLAESPLTVETQLRYDFVGTQADGSREQRVGSWAITWVRSDGTSWTATHWEAGAEVRSRLTGPGFTDITAHCIDALSPGAKQLAAGIDHWRTTLDAACGIDVYGNHGICAGDFDGSGFDSFYVCQPSGLPNRLYRNRGDGTFEDVTEASGVGILDGTASAIFADFFNRGRQDLLVVRTAGPLLFESTGKGRFEPRPNAFQFARPPEGTFTSAALADYNQDGLLDVYFCVYSYYQGLNQYQFPSPYYDAQNGPPNFLFRNRGDGTFEDVTAATGMDQNNNRFSFAAGWCDYDNDGWPDLYVANDFGRKNLYRNRGGQFTDVADRAGVEDYGPGMSACWLDYDNDGLQDVYVANMWLMEGKRITASEQFLPAAPAGVRALYQKHNAGNSMYRNLGNGAFEDRSTEAGTAMARWSWSCAAWDLEHAGYPDIYVANGFVSGPNHEDLQSFFWRQVAQRSLLTAGAASEYEMAWNVVNELVRSDYSWSGYERNVFYLNNCDGTFSDVSGVLGLDFRDDSRAYALSDFDHDGRLEIVLKNRTGPQLRILRSDLEKIGNSISFRLRGTVSNRDAIGAAVTLTADARAQIQFVSAGSGFASQHTKDIHFGVGNSTQLSASIRWPDGKVERYDHLPVNHRLEIVEGSGQFEAAPYVSRPAAVANPAALKPPPEPAAVGTWLIAPLFGPNSKLTGRQGQTHEVSELGLKPGLLTFVQNGCQDSREQLVRLRMALPEITAAGLSVCAVAAGGSGGEDLGRDSQVTFPLLNIDDRALAAWNVQYRYLFDRRREMALPSSFLLDRTGAVIRAYRGLTDPSQLVADWKSAPSTADDRLALALPFKGPYHGNPMTRNYFTYGVAFVEFGYLDEAQAAFQRALDTNPNYASAWFNLGTVYLNKKNFSEARRCLRESVRLNPQDSDAWNNLGMISGQEQKYDQALNEFRKAALANPDYLLPVQNMMRIYEYQHRPEDAEAALNELIGKAPANADLHLGLGRALVAQNKLEPALKELETVVKLHRDRADALNDLGALLLRMGRAKEALARFEEARRLAPDFDVPYINAALIYQSAGEKQKARDLLTGFLARHPDDAAARKALDHMETR